MKQRIPKLGYLAGFGVSTSTGVNTGEGNFASSITFGLEFGNHPCPFDAVFRNLTLYSQTPGGRPNVTGSLRVNNVDTLLSATLLSTDLIVKDIVHEVSVSAGDLLALHATTGSAFGPGIDLGFCVEVEAQGAIFGVANGTASGPRYGGALGNGVLAGYGGGGNSQTYSICPAFGNLTRLALRSSYGTFPSAGETISAFIRLNSVIQDGTGGTVNTEAIITDAIDLDIASFSLPVEPGDYIDVLVVPTGGAHVNCSCGVGFEPTTPGEYLICGGSNDVIEDWKWTRSEQLASPEYRHLAPIGPGGLYITGLYVERSAPGPGGYTVDHIVRRHETDTAVHVLLSSPALTGLLTGMYEAWAEDDTIDILMNYSTGLGTDGSGQFHWGLNVTTIAPTPPPPILPNGCPAELGLPVVAGRSGCAAGV